ncbi:MAG TPA: TonB-dependent receptor [Sphingomicrobium sp.]|jgi:outer membrane receptor protein involved in Fe transport|nr:TonB-dependent receptor [Sphingomicrobium sp.]
MTNGLNNRGRSAFLSSAAVLGFLVSTPAMAQQQPASSPKDQNATDSEEIVVTAQKRQEAVLDIPQSVSVVGGDTLDRQQANDIQQFANLVPGLSLTETNPGNTRIVIRGINTGGVGATVGVYVDEVPFGSSSGLVNGAILAGDFDTFDVQRLEVLRGPQGTLYGASSLGGVLKYVTVEPKFGVLDLRARGGIEDVENGGLGWNADAVINAPLGSNAAIRVSGFYRRDAGWIDAEAGHDAIGGAPSLGGKNINRDEIYGGRASLLFKPTDRLSIRLTAIDQKIDANDPNVVEVDPVTLKPIHGLQQTVFIPQFTDTEYRVYNGTIDYDLGFASLLSSTSYGRLKQNFIVDGSPVYGFYLTNYVFGVPTGLQQNQFTGFKKFTQEVRLTSPSNKTFEWLLGGFYTKESGQIVQDLFAYDLVAHSLLAGAPELAVGQVPSDYKEIAGFANGTWHITDRFDLTAGGRLSHNDQSASQVLSGPLVGGTTDFARTPSSESVFTYSVAPRFELNANTSVYARVATGYRPGGPNVLAPGAPAGAKSTYKSDRLTNYEVGLKTDAGRRLSFDASAFLLKWQDIQLFQQINNVGFNANGGKATSKGLEAQLSWRPLRGLTLLANGAFTNAKLDEDAPDAGGFKGDWLPWVPRTSFSLNADYDWMLSPDLHAFVGGGWHYVGRQYGDFDAAYRLATGHQRQINPYGEVDLRAGLDFRKFTLEAFVQNLTDSHGLTSATLITDAITGAPALPNGALSAGIIRPRTIGLTLTANIGS